MQGRKIRIWGVVLAVAVCAGCHSGGSSAYHDGYKAELRKDYDTALIDYQKAVQTDPENSHYQIHEKIARTQASLMHLKQGKALLASERPDEASGEFQKAVSIDPSNQAAAQELNKVLAKQSALKEAREKNLQEALKSREEDSYSNAVKLKPLPKEVFAHLRMPSTDARRIYESLGKLADINVAFPGNFPAQTISLDLTNVNVEDALRLVGYQTKTFYKVITPNTILVFPDNPGNHKDYDDQVLKTIYLSNPLQAADRTAITTALKQILQLTKIVDNPDSNAIIVIDTPEKVAAAEKMIHDLDQGKAEILIEVVVLEADRERIRDLGLTPATISGSGTVSPGIQGAVAFNPAAAATAGTATAVPVGLGNLSYRDYAVVLPSAAANAVLNDSRTHILQNPQVRVTDGQTAKVTIGSRIPYATGSFGIPTATAAGTGNQGLGGSLLSNTQFQFEDVGVKLELTPHLLNNGEVSLKANIDISSEGPSVSLGGIQQPTFNQRKIEHQIQLKEGEVNLLGGLIQTTIIHGVTGVPFLSEIPLLKYAFSTEHNDRTETEVLVMLTPRVVRLPEPSLAAGKGVVVGNTGQTGEQSPGQPNVQPQPPGPPQ
ncbi:MAG TPA: secretin N-terminal domain-containing protein [Terriglobia bacterium]|nr:secretin N-terminal domain-containing protein [Terriglobia bacterium]